MKIREMKITTTVLRNEVGPLWIFVLIKCLIRKRVIFNSTHWARQNTVEARFASRLAFTAAVYSVLSEMFDRDEAFRIVSKIIVPIGACEQWDNLRSLDVENKNGIERLGKFYDFMGEGGSGQFVRRKLVERSDKLLQFEVRECLFARFFEQVGMLELATLLCKVDRAFFPTAIPDYEFSRNDSWENTAAYKKDHCEFKFEKKNSFVDEKYIRETLLLDFTHPGIQMLYEDLDLPYKTDEKKINFIYEYVKREIKAANSAGKIKPASKVLKQRRGSNTKKTILFMALLRAGGVPCRVHFVTTSKGIQSRAEIFYQGEWVGIARWIDHGGIAPVDYGAWGQENTNAWGVSVLDDHGVFDSPDSFYKERL